MAISCAQRRREALGKRLSAEYTAATWHNHSPADVESFFAGLDLVGPGVTEAQTWRAWMPEPVLRRRDGHVLAGVGASPEEIPSSRGHGLVTRPCQVRGRVHHSTVPRVLRTLDATGEK